MGNREKGAQGIFTNSQSMHDSFSLLPHTIYIKEQALHHQMLYRDIHII